ncbi:MAG: PEGA domain-containing protein [Alistipes sp.]|nr:PEGA domain-containing protein [Alistipes sp.]
MKNLHFSALVALLTLIMVSFNAEAYGQSKKEIKRQQQAEFLAGLQPSQITVTFDSQPQGAKVVVDGKVVGITPVTTKVNVAGHSEAYFSMDQTREVNKIAVDFLKDGYVVGQEELVPSVSFVNDRISKARGYKFSWPDGVFSVLQKDDSGVAEAESNAYVVDNSIPAGEAQKAVNRDNPGQTALERTVIRWYFESQPQGARVYWRVISSVPDKVKNTNELWLGYTPFEETRSFNIQGLTYENSRDVQIEIKVRRQGYLDQTKRFNVRQAIDQQEISSFFDMIKAEE